MHACMYVHITCMHRSKYASLYIYMYIYIYIRVLIYLFAGTSCSNPNPNSGTCVVINVGNYPCSCTTAARREGREFWDTAKQENNLVKAGRHDLYCHPAINCFSPSLLQTNLQNAHIPGTRAGGVVRMAVPNRFLCDVGVVPDATWLVQETDQEPLVLNPQNIGFLITAQSQRCLHQAPTVSS